MKNTQLLLTFLCTLFLMGCSQQDQGWVPVYKNDKAGNTVLGSKEKLINAIRNGNPVRIAWGSKGKTHTIEHISDPIWIAILDEKEVIAHIDPQMLSRVDWETLSADYSDSTKLNEEWRVAITTKGEFDAVWYDKTNYKLIKRIPQNHVMTWFVKGKVVENASPFFEE